MEILRVAWLDERGAGHILRLSPRRSGVTVNGHFRPLADPELLLLTLLCRHADQPVSRRNMLQALWGTSAPCVTRIADVYIQRLRKALPLLPLETVFRYGYVLHVFPLDDPS